VATYQAEVVVPLPPDRVFDLLTDVTRWPQWEEGLLRVFEPTGHPAVPGATLRLDYGPGLKRTSTVLAVRRAELYRFKETGARVEDTVTQTLAPAPGGGTRLTTVVELTYRLGPLSGFYEHRWLGRAKIERELRKQLARFVEFATRLDADVRAGTCYSVDCGDGFRVVHLIAVDEEVVHLRLLPNSAKSRPTDPTTYLEQADALDLEPHRLPKLRIPDAWWARTKHSSVVIGQPLLALDEGLGVPHMAMTRGAFSDALPEAIGEAEVATRLLDEVESWASANGPVAGRDIDFEVNPLLALPMDREWAFGKVLTQTRKVIHLRIYSDRWVEPPELVNPWRLRLDPAWADNPGVGHVPLAAADLQRMPAYYMRLVMVGDDELEGYRNWKESGGGVFRMPPEGVDPDASADHERHKGG
jgi:uncharacterized protein YndB with AHSA1/START domain